MKKTTRDNLHWLLIFLSPTVFGILIIAMIFILICKYYHIDMNENGILVLPIFFGYLYIWSKLYYKIVGHSWLD
jgi:hypothetical protein